jgi:hypothetical protein
VYAAIGFEPVLDQVNLMVAPAPVAAGARTTEES